MPDTRQLSDKAVAVFAFAAYHQLESGQPVTKVIRSDGKGHQADEGALKELEALKLVQVVENDIQLTDGGLEILSKSVEALRGASRG